MSKMAVIFKSAPPITLGLLVAFATKQPAQKIDNYSAQVLSYSGI